MAEKKILRVYLNPDMLDHARNGGFNFVNRIANALEPRGFRIEFRKNSDVERLKSAGRKGYSLFLMDDPIHAKALTMRRSYFYPFWRIEASARRWEFEVAQTPFDAATIDGAAATDWADKWRKWLFKGEAKAVSRDGPIYVPLQGKLLRQRSFQSTSPVEMLDLTATRFPAHVILAGLHPGEVYSEKERLALDGLRQKHPNLTITTGDMTQALKTCRLVVTQNSSAAFFGYFFHKPAVLFGKIDFHHIASNTHDLGIDDAFTAALGSQPEFDRYLYWFTMMNAIRADAEDCEDQILKTLARRGWQVD